VNSSAEDCGGFLGFHHWFLQISEKKKFYLLTANKCGLNHRKPDLNQKKNLFFFNPDSNSNGSVL
jgi:hypothetical protein